MGSENISSKNVTIRSSRNRVSYSCKVTIGDDDRQDFPMFIAMANMCVTPTGFSDPKIRDALCSKIILMCGEISMAYTNRTTHLLAAHANTTKVELARERSLSVVTLDWVESIWNACQENNPYIHASLPQFKNFEYPLFYNVHFVFSKRYDLESKQFYENLVILSGGFVENSLRKAPNYIYVCQEPENGKSYKYAQTKEISCVPLAWIIESVNRKTLAKIKEFEIKGEDLIDFGTTFQMDERDRDFRRSLNLLAVDDYQLQNYPHSSNINDFIPGYFLKELIDNDIQMADVSSSTLVADTSAEKTLNESDSFEDEIAVTENSSKDGQVTSLITLAA